MTKKLKTKNELQWSTVVANNAMNRARKATGINSYEKDIRLSPINFISQRKTQDQISWIDLCCGQGNALIETANHFYKTSLAKNITLTGIDLVDYFAEHDKLENILELHVSNLDDWSPQKKYDLITIVHGLHYLGDKLNLISKAIHALKPDGVFIGNLDLNNIKITNHYNPQKVVKNLFSKNDFKYNNRSKTLKIEGNKTIKFPLKYLGADDQAGPNYTGQPVVDSFYQLEVTDAMNI